MILSDGELHLSSFLLLLCWTNRKIQAEETQLEAEQGSHTFFFFFFFTVFSRLEILVTTQSRLTLDSSTGVSGFPEPNKQMEETTFCLFLIRNKQAGGEGTRRTLDTYHNTRPSSSVALPWEA